MHDPWAVPPLTGRVGWGFSSPFAASRRSIEPSVLVKLPSVWSFAACSQRLLRPRLTSDEPSTASGDAPSCKAAHQISRGKARDLRSIPVASTPGCSEWHWASSLAALSPTAGRLVCASCSSGRSYACRFFPTTPRDDAVAVRLAVLAITARRGLAPPGHFPAHFRSPVQQTVPCPAHRNVKRASCKGRPLMKSVAQRAAGFRTSPRGRTRGTVDSSSCRRHTVAGHRDCCSCRRTSPIETRRACTYSA
jgi:hypothetical protein